MRELRQFATASFHRKEFDTTLKVRLDTLRAELTREKDAAILSLKQAQDSQLEELKEYYASRYASKVSEMQKLIDAKDAKIEELEAALGDPLSLWWKRVTGKKKRTQSNRSRRRRSRRRICTPPGFCRRLGFLSLVSRKYLQREGPEAGPCLAGGKRGSRPSRRTSSIAATSGCAPPSTRRAVRVVSSSVATASRRSSSVEPPFL